MDAATKYAKSGDVHIAYRVFGNGPRDIVLVPGTVSHVELYWELPANQYLLQRLAAFSRVIVFDKRGQGLSDRVADQTLDERVADVLAVMNAVGSNRATVYGWSEGGQMCLMLAATYPERVSGLVLYGTYASIMAAPWAVSRDQLAGFLTAIESHWGEGVLVRLNAPRRIDDKGFVQWFGRLERAVASPSAIVALIRANYEIDVSHLLPSIRVPTLILHRTGDALVPVEAGRYLARSIPGAKYAELPGDDHMLQALDQDVLDVLLDRIEEFVTGARHRPDPHRILATALSADPLGSANYLPVSSAGLQCGGASGAITELERCDEVLACGDDGRALAGIVARAEAIVAAARGAWRESEAQFIQAAKTFRQYGMWQEAQTFQTGARHCAPAIVAQQSNSSTASKSIADRARASSIGRARRSRSQRRRQWCNGSDRKCYAATSSRAVFRREGDYWTVAWQGKVVRVKDARAHHIAYLLANPGRQAACELAAAESHSASNVRRWIAAQPRTSAMLALLDARREQNTKRIGELRENCRSRSAQRWVSGSAPAPELESHAIDCCRGRTADETERLRIANRRG